MSVHTKHPVLTILSIAGCLTFASCSDDDCDDNSGGGTPPVVPFSHADHFTANPFVGPNMNVACIGCHSNEVQDLLATAHWNWEGTSVNFAGEETATHGKADLINNFCIAIPSNEGRCTQCHPGVGWASPSFDRTNPGGVDCLVCHDTTGTYSKDPKTAGMPVAGLDWSAIAAGIGMPNRANCGACHYNAGGGDNVKHGDLAVNLNDTTRDYDVHMGTDGGDFTCQQCHEPDADHGIGGMPLHSVTEGNMRSCDDCHTTTPHTANGTGAMLTGMHPTLACQVCHIPAIARFRTTKVEWYWASAGDQQRVPVDVGDGRFDYDKMKGNFVWANDVRPTLRRHDGKWNRVAVGVNDTYTGTPGPNDPIVLAEPAAPKDPAQAAGAMIYPFKKMVGDQVADTVNQQILVPHLFGSAGGPSPYWGTWDWNLALQDGAAATGQTYSGTFGFVDTVMYLSVNHEVAPKEMALGSGGCADCHGLDGMGNSKIDWTELGRTDPLSGN